MTPEETWKAWGKNHMEKTFTIIFNCDNEAFDTHEPIEIVRILRQIADKVL